MALAKISARRNSSCWLDAGDPARRQPLTHGQAFLISRALFPDALCPHNRCLGSCFHQWHCLLAIAALLTMVRQFRGFQPRYSPDSQSELQFLSRRGTPEERGVVLLPRR